jgi:hypothetical protein
VRTDPRDGHREGDGKGEECIASACTSEEGPALKRARLSPCKQQQGIGTTT